MNAAITSSRVFHVLIWLLLSWCCDNEAALDPELLAGMPARALGPAAVSGRIAAIDALNSDPNYIVVGAATGGVWISKNGGLTWTPVFDDQPVASIGAVAINQHNPDIIWVGTGEGNTRNSTSIGGGLYKSIDGGQRSGPAAMTAGYTSLGMVVCTGHESTPKPRVSQLAPGYR